MNFFDQYDRFYTTSQTGSWPVRLNSRYRAIIGGNEQHLRGQRVLDIASHDGRWSFAALQAGCADVTGIEAQPRLVEQANQTFRHYGVEPDRYRFIIGDMFDELAQKRADTVLLLGIYYHVSRHVDLARLVSETGASVIILDTCILPGDEDALIRLVEESTSTGSGETVVVGHPSRAAIKMIFGRFGFSVEEVDWSAYPKDLATLDDYNSGSRSTFVLKR
jgi:predicted nicotinamide N-methyase